MEIGSNANTNRVTREPNDQRHRAATMTHPFCQRRIAAPVHTVVLSLEFAFRLASPAGATGSEVRGQRAFCCIQDKWKSAASFANGIGIDMISLIRFHCSKTYLTVSREVALGFARS